MHKLGLKLWSTNDGYITPAIELYGDKVFDYVELFVVPGSAQYLDKWAEINLPIILHAPHSHAGLNLSLKDAESKNKNLIKEVDVFRNVLDPEKIIFHPGTNGSIGETIRQVKVFQDEFPVLFDLAVMENKPKVGLNGSFCMGASPEEMKEFLDQTKLGFCLDMGHAIFYAAWKGADYHDILGQFVKLDPDIYHLSDGDFYSKKDMHLNFGKGNFDLVKIISLIPPHAPVSVETNKKSELKLEDFREDVFYFRQCASKS